MTFRDEVREWLERHCPPSMRTPMAVDDAPWGGTKSPLSTPDASAWLTAMADRGWVLPAVPKEYGGGGLSDGEAEILAEELVRIGARLPHIGGGPSMVAPVLLRWGTEAQKARYLPAIGRAAELWAQGFSEPDAGSDLASLRTRAVRDGDEYVVNGQKIWTSKGNVADWIICLVRTDPDAVRPQAGISMLLIDMNTPGIRVRPIRLISGASMFCETFFDDVRVPVDNRVGGENQGWTIAKELLVHERRWVASAGDPGYEAVDDLLLTVDQALEGRSDEEAMSLRAAAVALELDRFAIELTVADLAARDRSGDDLGVLPNILKVASSELTKARNDLAIAVAGLEGLGSEGDLFDATALANTRAWLYSRADTIAGGTTEIQLNLIANAILGPA
jgi:acyl-CoA dehydrogenase